MRLSPMWRARVDALLPFLDQFTAPGFEAMEQVSFEPRAAGAALLSDAWPQYDLSPVMMAFVQALYDNQRVDGEFNWGEWQDEAQTWLDPARVATADVRTIQQLLTTHARKDRFCEGHLAAMVESGHLPALLRRLAELRGGTAAAKWARSSS